MPPKTTAGEMPESSADDEYEHGWQIGYEEGRRIAAPQLPLFEAAKRLAEKGPGMETLEMGIRALEAEYGGESLSQADRRLLIGLAERARKRAARVAS